MLATDALLNDEADERHDDDGCDQEPYPHRDIESAEGGLNVTINIFYDTILVHLLQFIVNPVDKMPVVTDITILSWHQCQVCGHQIIQSLFLNQILGLITETDHRIVFAFREFGECSRQVFDQEGFSTDFLQRILHGARHHHRNLLPTDITKTIGRLVRIAMDNLIIQTEHGTGVVGDVLTIGGIDHHTEIHTTFDDVVGNVFPRIGCIGERQLQSSHQFLGELHIKTMRDTGIVDILQRLIVHIDTENQGPFVRIPKINSLAQESKAHQQ